MNRSKKNEKDIKSENVKGCRSENKTTDLIQQRRDYAQSLFDSEISSDWMELQNMEYDPQTDTLY